MCRLIKEYNGNPYCLELIQFFGRHPDARYSGLAIFHAVSIGGEHLYIEKALRQLVDKGVVKTYSENNISLYSLTGNDLLRREAQEIARLDWGQWQDMLRQSYTNPWSYGTAKRIIPSSAIANG